MTSSSRDATARGFLAGQSAWLASEYARVSALNLAANRAAEAGRPVPQCQLCGLRCGGTCQDS
jgi:hypothetical protein